MTFSMTCYMMLFNFIIIFFYDKTILVLLIKKPLSKFYFYTRPSNNGVNQCCLKLLDFLMRQWQCKFLQE